MFPYAHRDLGLVPRGTVFQAALWAETRLMRRFDMIGCMSPANARYLTTQYRLHPKTKVQILPIWGPTDSTGTVDARAVRARHGLPFDRPICIFGGQLSEGRGIEEILATAVLARQAANEIAFVIIGEGRLRPKVERHIASGGDNVFLLGRVPREAYLELAAACDVGLVVTVAHTDVPTFPSRTIDYLRAGLPIVASVERTTDYGMFIADHQLGIAIEAGHPDQLLSAIQHTFREDLDRAVIRRRAKAALDTVFDVDNVARKMVDQMTGKRSDASMP
jgi:glycosyltransferase involved in cell wall biosynthesis